MQLWELFFIALGLSADAFAVAICKGLSTQEINKKHMLIVGLYFGGFQAIMPLVGYFLGSHFEAFITEIDHWIALVLLSVIGINMIRESFGEVEEVDCSFGFKSMFPLAIATSIDALAVGITFAFLKVQIVPAVSFIGATTFAFSALGICLGNKFGARYKSKAELTGGVILILMGIKIVLEHTGIL